MMQDHATLELDHIFIMCEPDAPEAIALARLGMREGADNTHPGQGTACRRFFFQDQYLELLWVGNQDEARSEVTRRTRLWDRWSARRDSACPFGIVLRTRDNGASRLSFPTWPYAPSYLPDGATIGIAVETPLTEPEFFVLRLPRGHARARQEAHSDATSFRHLTDVRIGTPAARPFSAAARWAESSGLLSFEPSDHYVLRLTFEEGASGKEADLRPELPLVVRW